MRTRENSHFCPNFLTQVRNNRKSGYFKSTQTLLIAPFAPYPPFRPLPAEISPILGSSTGRKGEGAFRGTSTCPPGPAKKRTLGEVGVSLEPIIVLLIVLTMVLTNERFYPARAFLYHLHRPCECVVGSSPLCHIWPPWG